MTTGADRLRISVVIPTYQRRDLVVAAVRSLAGQSTDQPHEVVVAVDGSTDGTAAALRDLDLPFPLTVVEQPNRGAAAARNLGASRAGGEVLLFLDDDMVADPHLLEEHDRLHRAGADAVLGHMPLHPDSPRTTISDGVAEWTEQRLARLSAPDAVLTLHDLLTGQLSVSARVFRDVSGFDASFTEGGAFGNEDVDLGHRLLEGGYDIRFNPAAISHQRYAVTPRQYLRQWRQAGTADVLFARKHPQHAIDLFVLNGARTRFATKVARPLARLPVWRALTAPYRAVGARAGERRGRLAHALFFQARALEYWRGVGEAGGIPQRGTLRVLAYHAIADLPGHPLESYSVPPERFRSQLDLLSRCGFRLVGGADAAAFLEGRGRLPRGALLVTFDDCYTDLLEAAAVLDDHRTDALAFAVTGLLGGSNEWDRRHGGAPLHLLDADGLEGLRRRGWEIGAHSRTHPQLPALPPADAETEIRGSVEDLRGLGLGPVRYFAYPYGEHDAAVRDVARRSGVTAAFAIHPGVVDATTDPMRIPRIEILRGDRGVRLLLKVACPRLWGRLTGLPQDAGRLAARVRRKVRTRLPVRLSALGPVNGPPGGP